MEYSAWFEIPKNASVAGNMLHMKLWRFIIGHGRLRKTGTGRMDDNLYTKDATCCLVYQLSQVHG
jgi:hypothetical protein